jgi:hypothetical protein
MLLMSLLAGTIHVGHNDALAEEHEAASCSISAGCNMDAHPCHDGNTGSPGDHCCDTHSHLSAITGHDSVFSCPDHDKQFTAVVPHLVPQDFSRIPFIPPRIIS